jgi:hypothetical protein
VGVAELTDELQLLLEPVGVLLFAFENVLEQIPAAVVLLLEA